MANMARTGVNLTGQTGTDAFVGSTSPTLVTPIMGVASATSIDFSSTDGVIGFTDGSSAPVGSVGEIMYSEVLSSAPTAILTNTIVPLTTISLSAGDWELHGSAGFTGGATTMVKYYHVWIASTTGTEPNSAIVNGRSFGTVGVAIYAQGNFGITIRDGFLQAAGTTTIYLNVRSIFTISTTSSYGRVWARRVR